MDEFETVSSTNSRVLSKHHARRSSGRGRNAPARVRGSERAHAEMSASRRDDRGRARSVGPRAWRGRRFDAAHNFEYMLIVVNPGSVLISLAKSSPVDRLSRKSTRASPAPSIARNAWIACRRTSAVDVRFERRRNDQARRTVEILRLVVVELARRHDLARHRRLGRVVAEDRALDLARIRNGALDDRLPVVVQRRS